MSFTDADRDYVRSALDRFEASGLQIWSELDRDLIVARALIDVERWKRDHRELGEGNLVSLFLALANETDSLTWYIDDVQDQFPALAAMDDEAAETLLQDHSYPIFVNASSICTVNEGNSLENMVYSFAALSGVDVSQTSQRDLKNDLTRVSFQVEGLGECHFDIESRKRPDYTPALAEMNRIAKSKNLGQYVVVPEGSSESDTFIFATEATLPKILDLLKRQVP
jgi:hypothetical protein